MVAVMRKTAWVVLVGLWAYTVYAVISLPQTVPVHFNLANEPDNFGSKHTLWLMPILGTIILGLFSIIPRHAEFLNYPVKITEANKARQQQLSFMLLSYFGLFVPVLFFYIVYSVVSFVQHGSMTMSIWVILAGAFLPIAFYFRAALKAR